VLDEVLGDPDVPLANDAVEDESHVVAGRQLRVARQIPDRRPQEGSGERPLEPPDSPVEDRRAGTLVEPDLRPRVVLVVEEEEIRHDDTGEGADLSAGADHIELDPVAADEPLSVAVIQTDRDPM